MRVQLDINEEEDFNKRQKHLLDLVKVREKNKSFFDDDEKMVKTQLSKKRTERTRAVPDLSVEKESSRIFMS